jgi:hypothetical protein
MFCRPGGLAPGAARAYTPGATAMERPMTAPACPAARPIDGRARRPLAPATVGLMALLAAPPAHAGWTVTATEAGCTYQRGSAEGDVTPIRVECDWTGVDAARLHAVLSDPGNHDRVFSGLGEATVVERRGAVNRVYQRFVAKGITDREVVVDIATSDLPGGKRYAWTKSADQSALRGDGVEVPSNSGKWEVTEVDGRVRLVYELRLAVGGMVPGFLMKWFQGGAIQQTIGELRRAVGG